MPTFCRHNRILQNCTICAREQNFQARPVVSSSAPRSTGAAHDTGGQPRAPREQGPRVPRSPRAAGGTARSGGAGVRVRRLARGAEDGFRSSLVPGLKSSEDAERLAQELAFSVTRLEAMQSDPAGLWADVANQTADIEERTWLAFLIAYIGPNDDEAPFTAIESARVSWHSGESPRWDGVQAGSRGAFDPARADATVDAYRAWAQRAGSQQTAFAGESAWTRERRFERVYERLALPDMSRDVRFELLTLLGRAGVYELSAGALQLSGENEATWAAKRALGIGDPLLLERRAADLAAACQVPLEALDLALHNWGSGTRTGTGFPLETEPDPEALAQAQDALGL